MVSVELAWVSVLLFWSQQTALNDDGEADSWAAPAVPAITAAADDAAAPQAVMERSPSQEMRVFLVRLATGSAACIRVEAFPSATASNVACAAINESSTLRQQWLLHGQQ